MKGILEQLAPHLLIVACYDREVIRFSYAISESLWISCVDGLYRSLIMVSFKMLGYNNCYFFSNDVRLIAEEQLLRLFRRMLEDKELFHMASTL